MATDPRLVVEAAVSRLVAAAPEPPRVGLILGSGLGHIAQAIEKATKVSGTEIHGYPRSTVAGHDGVFVIGRLGGIPVVALKGRIHGYEGHSAAMTALPARVLCRLGIRLLVVTNAAGGINRDFRPGDLMQITDHLNLTGRSPLEGPNVEAWGVRFPDLSHVYPAGPRAILRDHAERNGLELRQGVYACLPGPNYETPAEIRMLRVLGADAVGMSTVPEAVAAAHMRTPVLGISLISNLAAGLSGGTLSHEEVLAQAEKSGQDLGRILVSAMSDLAKGG